MAASLFEGLLCYALGRDVSFTDRPIIEKALTMFADIPSIIGAAHGTDISFVTGDYKFGPISSYVYPEGPNRNEMKPAHTPCAGVSDIERVQNH